MSGLSRVGAAVWRGLVRLVPAGRRDWAEAVWAEAPDVPPGRRRLAWRAGGARLIAREALMRRGIGKAVLFAMAAAVAVLVAWPGSPAGSRATGDRVYAITMVLLLAGLPLLARPFLGPVGDSRAARFLRFGTCAALLALIPARAAVDQFQTTPPRGSADLRVYSLIFKPHAHAAMPILFLVVLALYLTAIVWMTSRRARVAPATLAIGTGAGIALGLVMDAVTPLGVSPAATNPWLPGSDIDPLVVLAWVLLLAGPVTAAVIANRRYTASGSSRPPAGDCARQMMAAGLLTSLVGALFVTVVGTGTTLLMVKEAWLQNWLYHGHHLLYGVQDISSVLRTLPVIAYSHQITGATDTDGFFLICLAFPLIALFLTAFPAGARLDDHATGRDGPPRGGGGPPGPGPAPESPRRRSAGRHR